MHIGGSQVIPDSRVKPDTWVFHDNYIPVYPTRDVRYILVLILYFLRVIEAIQEIVSVNSSNYIQKIVIHVANLK